MQVIRFSIEEELRVSIYHWQTYLGLSFYPSRASWNKSMDPGAIVYQVNWDSDVGTRNQLDVIPSAIK